MYFLLLMWQNNLQPDMSLTDYFICDTADGDIIGYWDEDVRVRVIRLTRNSFRPQPVEIQFYGDDHGVPLAFETIDYNGEDEETILNAIRWYADFLNYPQMKVTRNNRFVE